MASVNCLAFLERPAGLGVHQVEQEADAAIILHRGFFFGREFAVLILGCTFSGLPDYLRSVNDAGGSDQGFPDPAAARS